MAKWISEWVLWSMVIVVGAGLFFVLWAIWPLLPERIPAQLMASLSTEGLIAMGVLLVVTLGFGKLMFAR